MESALEKFTRLTKEEIGKIMGNLQQYSTMEPVSELLSLVEKMVKTDAEMRRLNSEFARLNYASYEKYMAVHVNAIAIRGINTRIGLMNRKIPLEIEEEISYITSRYLLIEKLADR